MKQVKALYCLNVGFLHGARLDKTLNYDVVKDGYSFKAPFTPITFVKLCDLNQPLHHAGETYYFGFAPQEMQRLAALTKKDLEDALAVEQNRITTTRKKLQAAWEAVTALAVTEAQAVERAGGEPPVPSTSTASAAAPAVLPSPSQEEETRQAPAAPAPAPAPAPAVPANDAPGGKPVEGEVTRGVNAFNIYVSSAKADAAKAEGSESAGYCAQIKNLQTGELTEVGKGGRAPEFGKLLVLGLREAFESGVIPPSTKTSQTFVTVYAANEFIANMFAKGYLRRYSANGWKKKDGADIAHKAEWERIWKHASHIVAKGVVCEFGCEELKASSDRSREFANDDHKKRYGLIGPGAAQQEGA